MYQNYQKKNHQLQFQFNSMHCRATERDLIRWNPSTGCQVTGVASCLSFPPATGSQDKFCILDWCTTARSLQLHHSCISFIVAFFKNASSHFCLKKIHFIWICYNDISYVVNIYQSFSIDSENNCENKMIFENFLTIENFEMSTAILTEA